MEMHTLIAQRYSRLIVATDDAIFRNSSTLPNCNPLICRYV